MSARTERHQLNFERNKWKNLVARGAPSTIEPPRLISAVESNVAINSSAPVRQPETITALVQEDVGIDGVVFTSHENPIEITASRNDAQARKSMAKAAAPLVNYVLNVKTDTVLIAHAVRHDVKALKDNDRVKQARSKIAITVDAAVTRVADTADKVLEFTDPHVQQAITAAGKVAKPVKQAYNRIVDLADGQVQQSSDSVRSAAAVLTRKDFTIRIGGRQTQFSNPRLVQGIGRTLNTLADTSGGSSRRLARHMKDHPFTVPAVGAAPITAVACAAGVGQEPTPIVIHVDEYGREIQPETTPTAVATQRPVQTAGAEQTQQLEQTATPDAPSHGLNERQENTMRTIRVRNSQGQDQGSLYDHFTSNDTSEVQRRTALGLVDLALTADQQVADPARIDAVEIARDPSLPDNVLNRDQIAFQVDGAGAPDASTNTLYLIVDNTIEVDGVNRSTYELIEMANNATSPQDRQRYIQLARKAGLLVYTPSEVGGQLRMAATPDGHRIMQRLDKDGNVVQETDKSALNWKVPLDAEKVFVAQGEENPFYTRENVNGGPAEAQSVYWDEDQRPLPPAAFDTTGLRLSHRNGAVVYVDSVGGVVAELNNRSAESAGMWEMVEVNRVSWEQLVGLEQFPHRSILVEEIGPAVGDIFDIVFVSEKIDDYIIAQESIQIREVDLRLQNLMILQDLARNAARGVTFPRGFPATQAVMPVYDTKGNEIQLPSLLPLDDQGNLLRDLQIVNQNGMDQLIVVDRDNNPTGENPHDYMAVTNIKFIIANNKTEEMDEIRFGHVLSGREERIFFSGDTLIVHYYTSPSEFNSVVRAGERGLSISPWLYGTYFNSIGKLLTDSALNAIKDHTIEDLGDNRTTYPLRFGFVRAS